MPQSELTDYLQRGKGHLVAKGSKLVLCHQSRYLRYPPNVEEVPRRNGGLTYLVKYLVPDTVDTHLIPHKQYLNDE